MSIKRLENYMSESIRGQKEINKHIVENEYKSAKNITNQMSLF